MDWQTELGEGYFKDSRLESRFKKIVAKLSENAGSSIQNAMESWADTKAAYRFLSNERVDVESISSGHTRSTAERIKACDANVLVLHDTSEFNYRHDEHIAKNIGSTRKTPLGALKTQNRANRLIPTCGVLLHASLAISEEGLPLGLSSLNFWSRNAETMVGNRDKYKINATRIPTEEKESYKWFSNIKEIAENCESKEKLVHVCDREGDIFELYKFIDELDHRFVIRVCHNRCAEDESYIKDELSSEPANFTYQTEVYDRASGTRPAEFQVIYKQISIHPSKARESRYGEQVLTYISVRETNDSGGDLHWLLVTNDPVTNKHEACEKIGWYIKRWQIECFFKILKSGLGASRLKLRSYTSLVNALATMSIIAWRIQWISKAVNLGADSSDDLILSKIEQKILDTKFVKNKKYQPGEPSAKKYFIKLAMLGGYLARNSDPPPGFLFIFRGLGKLDQLREGFEMSCG